jgi:hypothetical protein
MWVEHTTVVITIPVAVFPWVGLDLVSGTVVLDMEASGIAGLAIVGLGIVVSGTVQELIHTAWDTGTVRRTAMWFRPTDMLRPQYRLGRIVIQLLQLLQRLLQRWFLRHRRVFGTVCPI